MAKSTTGGYQQLPLFAPPKNTTINIDKNHRLVIITDRINWVELTARVQRLRLKKLKNRAGKKPHLRQLIGALILKAIRNSTYRETEDLIRYYAPARYLCDLLDSDWTPDFTTIQDFAELMGQDGIALINEYIVQEAVAESFADPKAIAADTTAQEVAIPYPNEVGLMTTFISSLMAASKNAGAMLKGLFQSVKTVWSEAKKHRENYRFFAKTKTEKRRIMRKLMTLTNRCLRFTTASLKEVASKAHQMKGKKKQSYSKIHQLNSTMSKLLPQIRSWWNNGKVVSGKIVSLNIPQVYSMVRKNGLVKQ